jgi:hypothetical protein
MRNSAQAEERKDRHDHNDQTDEINDAMHCRLQVWPIAATETTKPAEGSDLWTKSTRRTRSGRIVTKHTAAPARQCPVAPYPLAHRARLAMSGPQIFGMAKK